MPERLLTIGEFSKLTGLTIKTLRFYHEAGLIIPASIDQGSGYRFYRGDQVDRARSIIVLRELGFSVSEMAALLGEPSGRSSLVEILEVRRQDLREAIRNDQAKLERLDQIIAVERQAELVETRADTTVRETCVDNQQIVSIRHRGMYSDSGKLFGKLARDYGRYLAGKPMLLCWDMEYKETDADFEAAFPVHSCKPKSGSQVYSLVGGPALSLIHHGPYEELHRSYRRLIGEASRRGFDYRPASREIYHKGPGMIFRGDPNKYVTEIQLVKTVEAKP